MKKIYKKLFAIVCAMALVISSFATYTAKISADTWHPVSGMNKSYEYKENGHTLTDYSRLHFYPGGATDYCQVIGSGNSGLANATVTVNGDNVPFNSEGFYREHSDAVVGFNLSKLEDDAYYDIVVTGSTGYVDFSIKKGDPASPVVQPTNVTASLVAGVSGAVTVTWQCTSPPEGQTYNVYADNVLMKTEYTKLTATLNNLSTGTHTIEVSGVYDGQESERASALINVTSAVKSTPNISVEGFQIQTNFPDRTDPPENVAFRTVCKAPAKGSSINVDGKTYTVKDFGTVYALDYYNNTGYNINNNLDASYTLLNETPVTGEEYTYEGLREYEGVDVTYGYVATPRAILDDYKPGDTDNSYYAITMTNMDSYARSTLFIRAFVVATDGDNNDTIIYGKTTTFTSVVEIADIIYTNSMAKNVNSHNYLYNNILGPNGITPSTNPHYHASPVTYGWNANLYIGFRKVPDSWNSSTHETEEMQYVKVGDYSVHASSYYDDPEHDVVGAAASYKGFTNEELAVRIDQPGWGHLDQWGNFINWGVQIKLPNQTAYARLENGKTYKMTVLYRASNAGEMKLKCEGLDTLPVYYNANQGTNKIEKTFVFTNQLMNLGNDGSIVLAPCGDDDTTHPGFPKGTVISDIDIYFTEQ